MSYTSQNFPLLGFALAAAFAASASHSDTVDARCELFPRGTKMATLVTPCTFSQHQGFIGVQLPQGTRYDFSPQGGPGRYTDQDGNPVTRNKGLGARGIVFRMNTQILHVYWSTLGLKSSAPDAAQIEGSIAAKTLLRLPAGSAPFAQQLSWGKIQFDVQSTNAAGTNTVVITPSGLSIKNRPIEAKVQGQLLGGEVADINRDGSPELYLYLRSNDNPPRIRLLAYSVNRRKSMSDIALPALYSKPEHGKGYRGWDQFAVVESSLVQRFPVFAEGAADSEPTSVRQIHYRLRPGEASWQLVVEKVDEF